MKYGFYNSPASPPPGYAPREAQPGYQGGRGHGTQDEGVRAQREARQEDIQRLEWGEERGEKERRWRFLVNG